jgi:hypothetical protein
MDLEALDRCESTIELRIGVHRGPTYIMEVDTALTVSVAHLPGCPCVCPPCSWLNRQNCLQIGQLKMKMEQFDGKLAADCHQIIHRDGKAVSNDVTIASTGVTKDRLFLLDCDVGCKVRRDASGLWEVLVHVVGM